MLTKTTVVYDLKNYRLNIKDDDDIDDIDDGKGPASVTDKEIEASYQRKIDQLKEKFAKSREDGPIQTTQLAMLAYKHDHFFVFLLKDRYNNYSLPTPSSIACVNDDIDDDDDDDDDDDTNKYYKLQNKELVSQWWRPHFDDNVYPYAPVHVATPVEQIKVELVELPTKCRIIYVKNGDDEGSGSDGVDAKKRKLGDGGDSSSSSKTKCGNKKVVVAVPFYDIFANEKRFGPIISSLPQILSCFDLSLK